MADSNNIAQDTRKHDLAVPVLRRDLQFQASSADGREQGERLLFDPVSDKYYRLDERDFLILSHLKAGLTLPELLAELQADGIDTDKGEIRRLISFLKRNHLTYPDPLKSDALLEKEWESRRRQRVARMAGSYISLRIPLFKPDAFLTRTVTLIGLFFNRWTMTLLILVACWGYLSLFPNWTRFRGTFFLSLNRTGMLNYFLAIVAIKIIHELGHAYSAKLCGIRVREFGIAFIVFMPRLYTDLTDSWQVADRKKRMFIDAAGIVVELIIGGLAALLWSNTGSGPVHAVCYFLFTVTMLNTLFFNGNPLMRFDGYYLLCDFLGVDNLYGRSVRRVKKLFRRLLWRLEPESSESSGRALFIFYGFAAFFYRLFLYTSIIAVVYFKFMKLVGIVLALIEIQQLLIKPFFRELAEVQRIMKKQRRYFYARLAFFLAVPAVLFFLPLPYNLVIPCEVKSGQRAIIYILSDGYLRKQDAGSASMVKADARLLAMDNPFLEMDLADKQIEKKILQEELKQISADSSTLYQRNVKLQQLESLNTVIAEIRKKKAKLTVKSKFAGEMVAYDDNLELGKWLNRGEAFGEVFNPENQLIYGYVSEDKLRKIGRHEKVMIYFSKGLEPMPGSIVAVQNVPLKKLESTPLQDCYGGVIRGRKKGGWQAVDVLYQVLIKPDRPLKREFSVGRSGIATCRRSFTLASLLIRRTLEFFQKEKVF